MPLWYRNCTIFAFNFVHLIKCTFIFNFYIQILQYANQLQALWPPQPTPSWTGAKIYKLSQIQQALALLPEVFRKPPETSKSIVLNIVKSHQKFQKHEDDDSKSVEATDYCRKLGLPGTSHINKVAKGLAKFVRQQLGLEMVDVSKSNLFIAIDLHQFYNKNQCKSIELI